jgi:hypothetical protein
VESKKGRRDKRRKLHNEEFHKLYSLPNLVRMIKPRRLWAWHVACMGKRNAYSVLVGEPEETNRKP